MEGNNGSLTMNNEASQPVTKFVLRHAYATPEFTFVRAHAWVDLLSRVEQAFIKSFRATRSREENCGYIISRLKGLSQKEKYNNFT